VFRALLVFFAIECAAFSAEAAARAETFFIFEQRKLSLWVPVGFEISEEKDTNGLVVVVRMADANERCSLEIRFVPDAEGRFSQARARRELIHEVFGEYVSASSEKGMQFEELEARVGAGTYCVFTDSKLVGKSNLPPGEYLHVTSGVKAWPGVAALFRCFSNDTISPEYQAVMKVLRESLQEKTVPLL